MHFNELRHFIQRLLDWSHWPHYLFYFPLMIPWLAYYVRSRSLWFFTPSNPTLAFGGFEGEGKRQMYDQLPAEYCPKSLFIKPFMSLGQVLTKLEVAGFTYPFIVKPDVGMKGILFRKIENELQLRQYHIQMPADYIIQEFLDLPLEVSVFYCRKPFEKHGKITALIQKNLLEVCGDGVTNLSDLILQQPIASRWVKKSSINLDRQLGIVLKKGERYCLSHVANLFHGAQFKDLKHLIDDQLTELFDRISRQNHFYYGRYDIKCNSVEEMKEGQNFYILEFNGAGSVPNHIYAGKYSLLSAYREILTHWRWLYDISQYNHENGFPRWSLKKGHYFLKNSKKHFKVLKKLDKELILS
ncbi:hypothetical protein SY85_03995 [Flavisolibacter tropicus]|uniref:ATP-grasp domain-containing protein n=2 Tax=Flavisolibacter tropicus TaxID=1492898 RepID=A0A172TRX5_9BACT|nr:hypothetical protein SY85_03995 [Flavisolibacter tropicus]